LANWDQFIYSATMKELLTLVRFASN